MKKYFVLIAFPFVFACNSGNEKKTVNTDSLTNINHHLETELAEKETNLQNKEMAMNAFITSFNEIQNNLNEIKAKEKIISAKSSDKELKKTKKDEIISDIQTIYDLLNKNKQKVSTLTKKLKSSNLQVDEINLAVTNLNNQLNDKENEIINLKAKLEKLNMDFSNLNTKYVEELEASHLKTEKLNTAYYVVGTKKDLIEKGVVSKKGGFIGIGRVAELNESMDENYFTRIDITATKEIPIHADHVTLVSTHPAESYRLIEGSSSIDKIVIVDSEKFWSISKYLIITTSK